MDFPRTADEITTEWLTGVLRDSGAIHEANVRSFELENIGDGQGAWSVVNRVVLDYDTLEPAAPRSVVAKTGFQSEMMVQNPDLRMEIARINEREARFYQELATDCGLGTPKHYFSSYDMETAEVIYLLEDAGHLRTVDQSSDCILADGRVALLALANMHLTWWQSEELGEHHWLRHHGTNARPELVQWFLEQSIDSFLKVGGNSVPIGLESIARKLLPKLVDVSNEVVTAPVTLVHGDYTLSNLFFDDSEDVENRVVAFDWQTVGRVRSSNDVSRFMSTSFDVASRREHEQYLLTEYHSALFDGGVKGYSYDEFLKDVRLSLLLDMARRINSTARTNDGMQASEEGRAHAIAMVERLQILVDWNCEEVIPA